MFEITIKKTTEVRRTIGKTWEKIQIADGKTEYGYTPEVETVTTETQEIYHQSFETLDLVRVILAANNIDYRPLPQEFPNRF